MKKITNKPYKYFVKFHVSYGVYSVHYKYFFTKKDAMIFYKAIKKRKLDIQPPNKI
jgi:hypothetical protein